MPDLDVDGIRFEFPSGWKAYAFDQCVFYREQFSRMWNGIKAIDVLALAPDGCAWLIEAKDYRQHPRTKPSELGDEVAKKVFATLAALLPAKLNANDATDQAMAAAALRATRLRVVLHLEQRPQRAALWPRGIDPVNIQQSLKRLLKPIDAHPLVVASERMGSLSWSVKEP